MMAAERGAAPVRQTKGTRGSRRCHSGRRKTQCSVFIVLSVLTRHFCSSFTLAQEPSSPAGGVSLLPVLFHREISRDQPEYCVQGGSACADHLLHLSCRRNRLHCTSLLAWVRRRSSSCCCSTWPTPTPPRPTATRRCTSLPGRDKWMSRPCCWRRAPRTPCPPK